MDFWNELIKAVVSYGVFAVLFVFLFFYQLKDSAKREEAYRQTIESLTKHLQAIEEVREEVEELKNHHIKGGRRVKEKLKSYSFWSALSGAMVIFVNALGKIFGFSVEDELISGLIMAIAGVPIRISIVTMPSSKNESQDSFSQKQEDQVTEEEKNSSDAEKSDSEK